MRNFKNLLANVLIPPRCLSCGAEVQDAHSICAGCWGELSFIENPVCITCGVPMPESASPEAECLECVEHAPPFAKARAALHYEGKMAGMIARFKYADQLQLLPLLARWMKGAGQELCQQADVVVPVPLHWTRLFLRKYNQSALLAQYLAHKYGKPYLPQALKRIRRTSPQASLGRGQRLRNVQGAFRINPALQTEMLRGKTVLLVDDVMTTGATIHACSKALKKGGVKKVLVLTVARTVQGE